MRKLTYYIATTIDGFIAAPDGSADFFPLTGDHSAPLTAARPETVPTDFREAAGITEPNKVFDTVLMGRVTYEQALNSGIPSPYSHLRQYVFSRTLKESTAVEVVTTDPLTKVRELKQEPGKGIWLCGGGQLAGQLRPEIDELVVKINPIIAGSGIPLFGGDFTPVHLTVAESKVYESGVAVMTYVKQ